MKHPTTIKNYLIKRLGIDKKEANEIVNDIVSFEENHKDFDEFAFLSDLKRMLVQFKNNQFGFYKESGFVEPLINNIEERIRAIIGPEVHD